MRVAARLAVRRQDYSIVKNLARRKALMVNASGIVVALT
jgi:hypothetical protein